MKTISIDNDLDYREALSRIESESYDDRCLARRAIAWVFYAYRPLSDIEFTTAVALRSLSCDSTASSARSLEQLLSLCHGLLAIDANDRLTISTDPKFPAYLKRTKNEVEWLVSSRDRIAEDCIRYLQREEVIRKIDENIGEIKEASQLEGMVWGDLPLIPYAARYWGFHASQIRNLRLARSLCAVLKDEAFIKRSVLCLWPDLWRAGYPRVSKGAKVSWSALHLEAYFGIDPIHWSEIIYPKEASRSHFMHGHRSGRGTPLHIAAREGHIDFVKWLLTSAHFAGDLRSDRQLKAALRVSAQTGNEEMLHILLDYGNNSNSKRAVPSNNFPALAITAARGVNQKEIERILQEEYPRLRMDAAGAQLSKDDQRSVNTFLQQLPRGDLHGHWPDAWSTQRGTLLQMATTLHNVPAIKMLLQRGADVHLQYSQCGLPLDTAASNGRLEIARLLLANGATVTFETLHSSMFPQMKVYPPKSDRGRGHDSDWICRKMFLMVLEHSRSFEAELKALRVVFHRDFEYGLTHIFMVLELTKRLLKGLESTGEAENYRKLFEVLGDISLEWPAPKTNRHLARVQILNNWVYFRLDPAKRSEAVPSSTKVLGSDAWKSRKSKRTKPANVHKAEDKKHLTAPSIASSSRRPDPQQDKTDHYKEKATAEQDTPAQSWMLSITNALGWLIKPFRGKDNEHIEMKEKGR